MDSVTVLEQKYKARRQGKNTKNYSKVARFEGFMTDHVKAEYSDDYKDIYKKII